MGNKKSRVSPPPSQTSESCEETFKFLNVEEVKAWLFATDHAGKVGYTVRYLVCPDQVEAFVAAAKEQDKNKLLEFIASTSFDVFADANTTDVFWSLGTADTPVALSHYLEDEKVVKFNEATASLLQAPPGYALYKAL